MKYLDPANEYTINYQQILSEFAGSDLNSKIKYLSELLPQEWVDQYYDMTPRSADVVLFNYGEFQYLFDMYTYPTAKDPGIECPKTKIANRVVAVFGRSSPVNDKRELSRMRGWIGPTEKYLGANTDKGHFIAHTIGGLMDVNLFPQRRDINRGWSIKGKIYRSMERYCFLNPGTFCFSRPIYFNHTDRPSTIEFGLIKKDGFFWVDRFEN